MNALALSALLLGAATPHVTQVLSARQAKLGEPIELDVTVTHARGEKYELVVPDDLGAFSVLERSQTSDGEVTHLKLKLAVYAKGKNALPQLAIKELTSGTVTPLSQDVTIETIPTLSAADPLVLHDLAPPHQPYALDPLKVGLAVISVVALAALVAFVVRRSRKPESEEARDKRLLAGLQGLEDEPFYEALDGILRRSLARSHGVPAIERTSEEIAGAVARTPPPGLEPEEIASVLREAVWVRYAHRPSTAQRKTAALDVCRRLLFPPQPQGTPDARASLS